MSHSNRILSIVSAFLLMAVAAVAQDLVKVAPKNVKVLLDNSQVRVLEYTSKKGVKIGLHSHPPYVVYALASGTTHFTLPDGKTKVLVLKKGEAIWSDQSIPLRLAGATTALFLLGLIDLRRSSIPV